MRLVKPYVGEGVPGMSLKDFTRLLLRVKARQTLALIFPLYYLKKGLFGNAVAFKKVIVSCAERKTLVAKSQSNV